MPTQRPHVRPVYTIDAVDRIVEANAAFVHSLAHVEPRLLADGLSAQSLIGRSIWEFVRGALPRQLWQVLYGRVRAVGAPVFVPLREDTATERRLVDVELHNVGERSIRHVREYVSIEPRAAVALLDANYPRDDRRLVRCAWCARIQVGFGLWQEAEQAHVALRLEATRTLPSIKEGACAACKQSVLKTFPVRVA